MTMELTPGELAEADQVLAKLTQARDAISTYAGCIFFAKDGDDAAVISAHKHIAALVYPLGLDEITSIIIHLSLILFAQTENLPTASSYWNLLSDEERDYIANFLASGGTQCCTLGVGNHSWDSPDVEE